MNQKALRAGFFLGILLDFFLVTVYPNFLMFGMEKHGLDAAALMVLLPASP